MGPDRRGAYEQHTGRRLPGQAADGSFQVSVGRTVDGTLEGVLERWLTLVGEPDALDGVPLLGPPRTSGGGRHRYWRCRLADGSRIELGVSGAGPGCVRVGVGHERIASEAAAQRRRSVWRALLADL